MHGIQNRITNLIPMIIALFALEFLTEESGSVYRYFLRSKRTGNFVSSAWTNGLLFSNLLALAYMFRIRFIRIVGINI